MSAFPPYRLVEKTDTDEPLIGLGIAAETSTAARSVNRPPIC